MKQLRKAEREIKSRFIAQGALTLALIIVFYSFFKGVTNIFNAFFVPLTLAFLSLKRNSKEMLAIYILLFMVTLVFFQLQIFFTIFYGFLAILLAVLHKKKFHPMLSLLILSIGAAVSFGAGIFLTDLFFLTRVQELMMKLLKENIYAYVLFLWVEGALVGAGLLLAFQTVKKRIFPSIYN